MGMFAGLVFLLLALKMGTEGASLNRTENTTHSKASVVGGVEVVPHSLPYQVGLLINDKYFCGGVLISAEYVLTAAHCVYGSSSIKVILGAHNINNHENTQQVFYNPITIIHENFNKTTLIHDIALLKLKKRAELTWAIKQIRYLADNSGGNFEGHVGLLSGWGYTSHSSGHVEKNLRQVYLSIIHNQKCSSNIHVQGTNIMAFHICTSGNDIMFGSVGACSGDSGGPLVVNNVLVGLVSFGYEICEAGYPTVYTRISYYRDWIAKYSGV